MRVHLTLPALAMAGLLTLSACGDGADSAESQPDSPPAEAGAEQTAPPAGQQLDPEMVERMMEAQQIQQQLGTIEQEAMQDPELASQLESIQERVETAMRAENAELFERMDELEAEFEAAQEAEDEERLQAISQEAQGMQMELQTIQQRVLEQPEISEAIDQFEEARRSRMIEIDPEAEELLNRMDEIMDEMDPGGS